MLATLSLVIRSRHNTPRILPKHCNKTLQHAQPARCRPERGNRNRTPVPVSPSGLSPSHYPRGYADGSAWVPSAGTPLSPVTEIPCPLLTGQGYTPSRSFHLCRPTALDAATKEKLRRLAPSVFPWSFFLSPHYPDADGSPRSSRTLLHTSSDRYGAAANCAGTVITRIPSLPASLTPDSIRTPA